MFLALVIYVVVVLLVIEVLSTAFEMTGVPHEKAKFQVIAMFTSGYSTKESEIITQHPVRRKLALFVMIFTYVSNVTLFSIIVNLTKSQITKNLVLKSLFVLIIFLVFLKNRIILESKLRSEFIKHKWFSINRTNVYYLLSKNNGYGLYNLYVDRRFKFTGQTIKDSILKEIGVQILNVDKGNKIIEFPEANYKIELGDNLLVYCKLNTIKKCFYKGSGIK